MYTKTGTPREVVENLTTRLLLIKYIYINYLGIF